MLVLLAVLMFGPEKIPPIARKAARVYKYLSNVANDARGQLASELGPGFADLTIEDLNPRTFITKHVLNAEEVATVREALADAKDGMTTTAAEISAATDAASTAGRELVDILSASSSTTAEVVPDGVPYDLEAT